MAGTRCGLPDPGSAGLQPGRYGPPAPGSAGLQPGLAGLAVSRRALTLLELLVVVGIMLLVAAIGAGVWFNAANTSRLVASERLVAGLVRQARHTARTSGQPVTLLFSKDERTVAGIARVPLWQERFEDALPPIGLTGQAGAAADPAAWLTRGCTGQGLRIAAADLAATPIPAIGPALERERRLIGRASLGDGFLLGAAVDLPAAIGAAGDVLPLLLISTETSFTGGLPSTELACAGLLLHRRTGLMFDPTIQVLPMVGATANNPDQAAWDVVGWIRPAGGTVAVLSLLGNACHADDPTLTTPAGGLATSVLHNRLRLHGLAGGTWTDLALSWDGRTLLLLVDGRLAASVAAPGPRLDPGPGSVPHLWLGQALVDEALRTYPGGADGLGDLPKNLPRDWRIDNASLSAAGAGQAGQLPQGVAPTTDHQVVCLPDGRVLVDGASSGSLELRGDFDRADTRATIAIRADGTVASQLAVTP